MPREFGTTGRLSKSRIGQGQTYALKCRNGIRVRKARTAEAQRSTGRASNGTKTQGNNSSKCRKVRCMYDYSSKVW